MDWVPSAEKRSGSQSARLDVVMVTSPLPERTSTACVVGRSWSEHPPAPGARWSHSSMRAVAHADRPVAGVASTETRNASTWPSTSVPLSATSATAARCSCPAARPRGATSTASSRDCSPSPGRAGRQGGRRARPSPWPAQRWPWPAQRWPRPRRWLFPPWRSRVAPRAKVLTAAPEATEPFLQRTATQGPEGVEGHRAPGSGECVDHRDRTRGVLVRHGRRRAAALSASARALSTAACWASRRRSAGRCSNGSGSAAGTPVDRRRGSGGCATYLRHSSRRTVITTGGPCAAAPPRVTRAAHGPGTSR